MKTLSPSKPIYTVVLSLVLWILTIILGIIAIAAFQDLVALIYLQITNSELTALHITFGNPLTFVLAVGLTIFAINSGKFHRQHLGQQESWRLFSLTIGTELLILAANMVYSIITYG